MSGVIHFEEDLAKKDTYALSQDQSIQIFKQLREQLAKLAAGDLTPAAVLSDGQIYYLNGAYLYCVVNYGSCKWFLDSILELDVINAKIKGPIDCPNITAFWKLWVRNEMEQRHKYMVKTPFMNITNEFNSKVRPAYLRCQPTVATELQGQGTTAETFRTRYMRPEIGKSIDKMLLLLDKIKTNYANIYIALGAGNIKKK